MQYNREIVFMKFRIAMDSGGELPEELKNRE